MANGNGSQNSGTRKPEDMSSKTGNTITLAAFGIPLIAFAILGLILGNGYTAAAFTIVWVGIFIASSIRFIRKRKFIVVERFGLFWDVKFAGPRLMIPWIDNEVMEDDFLQKSVSLFTGIDIDFIGGSAPILADGWYQIGNPDDFDEGNEEAMERIKDQVLKYTYRVQDANRAARIADIFQGAFRTFLEQRTIVEAQKDMEILATDGTDAARDALKEIGVYPFPKKGIIVRDIVLPPEIVALREQVLRGEMDAKEAVARAQVYWKPLTEMKRGFAEAQSGAMSFTDAEILQLFLAQKGFDTLPKIPAHVTLISKDIGDLQKIITVGGVSTETGGPS